MELPESKAQPHSEQPSDHSITELIAAQKKSGLSIAAFARKHGVPVWKLYRSGSLKRNRHTRKRRPDLIEVAVTSKVPESSPIEIILPGDLRVRVLPDFDEHTLRRILGAISSC